MNRRLCSVAAAVGVTAFATVAAAESAVIATRPVADDDSGDVVFFVGAINASGRSLKASTLDMIVDGVRSDEAIVSQSLSEWATASSEASQTWRSPMSVGLVYLWVQGVPPSVLDGIQSFFQRVPSRTPVYPTIYGRMRQGRARLTAADVSRLGDVAHLEGYRPNLIEAVRLDLPDLAADSAPLRLLLLVTDGRDFADPKGEGPGDFAALGRAIRKAGVTPIVVAFPASEADAAQAAANLRDLHEAAGGFLRTVDQIQDIENILESLGQAVADLQRVSLAAPATWRVLGGAHRLSVRLTASDGQRLTAEVGTVTIGPKRVWLIAIAGALVVLVGLGAAAFARARRRPPPISDDLDVVLSAAHDLIRRGASPKRAVEELTRAHSSTMNVLVDLDPELLADPRFPYFRTRPGRLRMQEIRDILAKKSADGPAMGDSLAEVLAEVVQSRIPSDRAAGTLVARVAGDDLNAFAGLGLEQLAEALRRAARKYPTLGSPRARGAAVSIQDALRSRGGAHGIVVGWLVRAGGPGPRGETLKLADGRTLIGQGPDCGIRIAGDAAVAAEHAEFSIDGGEFAVASREGPVTVEGVRIDRRHVLTDGETLAIGGGLFVFKSASAGTLSRASTGPTPPGAAVSRPR